MSDLYDLERQRRSVNDAYSSGNIGSFDRDQELSRIGREEVGARALANRDTAAERNAFGSDIDITGPLMVSAAVGVLVAIGAMILAPITWWTGAGDILRPILNNSPIASAIADSPKGDGNPLLAVGVVAALVGAAAFGISLWRRQVARRAAAGEINHLLLLPVSLVRTVVIVGGLTMLPAVAGVALGGDLKKNADDTFVMGGLIPILLVVVGVVAFSFYSTVRIWQRTLDAA